MAEEQRKTLRDCLLEGGAKGAHFIMGTEKGSKIYTVLDIQYFQRDKQETGKNAKLVIKEDDNKESSISLYSHFNDLEVATELTAGKFYELLLEDNKIVFCDGKRLIDSSRNELDPKTKGLSLIRDETSYMTSLRQNSEKLTGRYNFMKSCLEEKLRGYQKNELTDADTAFTGEVGLEEVEEDVNLDSFGSGSGLLDLSLQADDTSLGGILDEIYAGEKPKTPKPTENEGREYDLSKDKQLNAPPSLEEIEEDVNLDSFGSGSGLLDLSLQADDTSLGGILDETSIDKILDENHANEAQQPAEETKTPLDQKPSELGGRKNKRGFWKTLKWIFWE